MSVMTVRDRHNHARVVVEPANRLPVLAVLYDVNSPREEASRTGVIRGVAKCKKAARVRGDYAVAPAFHHQVVLTTIIEFE